MRALLVDFSFEQGVLFRKPNTRGLVPGQLVAFAADGSPARPTAASAAAAADRWITETMDEDTAQDYVTGDSADEAELLAADTPQGLPAGSPAQDNVLAKRVAELEALVRQQQQALQAGQDLQRLRTLAGPAPRRLGAHEHVAPAVKPEASAGPAMVEMNLEATDQEEVQDLLDGGAVQDPVQRMLALQMRQTNTLLQHLLGSKSVADPVQAALAGGDGSSSGSSQTGVKGCVAREAFVKIMNDPIRVADLVEANAAQELGLSANATPPNLMLDLQGFAAKGLMFVEQTCLDGGRTQLGWLLTGVSEPNLQLLQLNKKKSSLKPFSRLAHASWVAANVSYLRDLDYLEGRMKNLGATKGKQTEQMEEEPNKRKQFRRKDSTSALKEVYGRMPKVKVSPPLRLTRELCGCWLWGRILTGSLNFVKVCLLRSSSSALGRVFRTSLGYILGGGLYPGPSREQPQWLVDLQQGSGATALYLATENIPLIAWRG
ncbi:unnamed protein product, partial [Effrenium voratum]